MASFCEGKVAVVTGAGGTLCSCIAKDLASKGAKVVLIGRTREKLEKEYARFVKNNGERPFEEFVSLLRYNNRCDALANVFIKEHRAEAPKAE